jgi:hypothetical protein
MIENALSESALLFGNTNKVFASFERTPNLFVPEKMSSSFPISLQNCSILLFKELFGFVRKKYLCKYQKAWETEISWLSHGDRSVNDAYCILCKSHLSIGSGAKNDLTRHAKSQNHMQLEMVQRKSKSMSLFVTTPNNSLKSNPHMVSLFNLI